MPDITVTGTIDTPLGRVYMGPDGRAMATWRIGECRGRMVSTVDLSDAEIEAAGLTGRVLPGTDDANRLYPEGKRHA